MELKGIIRETDTAGRIVIPVEMRQTLGISENDALEIFIDNDSIILRKYAPACVFCGNTGGIIYFNGKRICSDCIHTLKEQG